MLEVLAVEPLIWGLEHVDLQPDCLVLEPLERLGPVFGEVEK